MEPQWYISQEDERLGPLPLAAVQDLIARGKIKPTAWFSRNDEVWMDFEQFRRTSAPPVVAAAVGAEPAPAEAAPDDERSVSIEVDDTVPEPPGELSAPVIERDAILLLGRRRAGKTIYLATLYANLWKAVRGLTMKALSGPAHEMLMGIVDQLKRGEWPEATLGTRQIELEIDDHGKKRLLVAFDYSGEDFRRAFVEEDTNSPQVKRLLNYVDRAAAVILLLDPAVAVSGKHSEVVDDDFGMVQAVERIRNWQGGTKVPVVIALTKADRNKNLIQSHGSGPEFILRNYPALARTLQRVAIFAVSAVQEVPDGNGAMIPSRDSLPINVELPLLQCLRELSRREARQRRRAERAAADATQREAERVENEAYVRDNRRLSVIMVGVLVLIACGLALLYMAMTR